jgi:K+-sensing histidine kinase KdpD
MERQVEKLKRLVADILDVARINNGKIELRRELLDLRTVVGQAIESERYEIVAARHELSTNLPPAPVWVTAMPSD